MSVSMDEINFLVWRYMQENGFPHAAYVFETESLADTTNITTTQIPPGALISLLQKSIVYLNLEKSIRMAKADPNSNIASEIEKINQAFPHTNPNSTTNESNKVTKLTNEQANFITTISPIENFEWSPDGKKIATIGLDGSCSIHAFSPDGQFQQLSLPPIPPTPSLKCPSVLSWNSTSELIAIASETVANVFTIDGNNLFTITGGVTALKFCPTQPLLVTCSKTDFNITLWQIRDGQASQLESYSAHSGIIYDIAWRDEGLFATASHDKTISFCSISGTKQILSGHMGPITCVAFSKHKALMASGSDDGCVRIWKDGGRVSNVLKGHSAGIVCIEWHPVNANTIASASLDGTVKTWDALSGECTLTFAHHTDGIAAISLHPSGKYLATGGKDGVFALWKIPEAQVIFAYTYDAKVTDLDFSPSGEFLAVSFKTLNVAVVPVAPYLSS